MKLLCLCDSPTAQTGFARVAQNLLSRWSPHFEQIDVWGINYTGWPHKLPYRIFPGGTEGWNSHAKLRQFRDQLMAGGYSHLWILQDPSALWLMDFPLMLRQVCAEKKIRSFFYFPVDAPMDPEWTRPILAAGCAVAYTRYGRDEALRAMEQPAYIRVLPHGVDSRVYHPLPDRDQIRKDLYGGWIGPEDFLLLNVNVNQRRKGLVNTLQILARLKTMDLPRRPRLLMHMNPDNAPEQIHLEIVARQLGLVLNEDWKHTGEFFVNNRVLVPEKELNRLYNSADLVLSTSLGEGWGFSITESLAAGTPVAAPDHTSCHEIAEEVWGMAEEVRGMNGEGRIHLLPVIETALVNMRDHHRVRYPVDVPDSALAVASLIKYPVPCGVEMNDAVRRWLSWDRIAMEWIQLFRAAEPPPPPTAWETRRLKGLPVG